MTASIARIRVLVDRERQVIRNAGALALIQLATYLLPLITMPYLVRTLGLDKYGLVAYAQALNGYFVILTDFGFAYSATRSISVSRHDPDERCRIASAVIVIRLGLLVVSAVIMACLLLWAPNLRAQWQVHAVTFGMVIASAISLLWYYQGIERMDFITYVNLAFRIIVSILFFVLIHAPSQYLRMSMLVAGTEISIQTVGWYSAWRYFGLRLKRPSLARVRQEFVASWHPFTATLAVASFSTSRVFAVGLFSSQRLTGAYAVAERLMTAFQTFPLAPVLQALYPRLARLYAETPSAALRWMRRLQKITTASYVIGLPVIWIAAPYLVRLVHGDADTVLTFRLLMIAVALINANAFRVQYLLVSRRDQIYSRIHVASAVVGAGCVFAGAKWLANVGPALALILVTTIILTATIIALRRTLRPEETQ